MKNAKLLKRDAQKAITGGMTASGIKCCEKDRYGNCTLYIGPGQYCP
ncbi:hypothetical protein V2E39_10705 [Chryseobacterium arthrosphaerae]|uniref:Bacteriocin n=1 Tax=Chryseobacterium arthrosphaerae TaxID=651561 RepID=A0ABU7QZD9_9FLAO|nr:hypothetical protein [Chryseobacterium arthrosphaerae]UEQ74475.1 hypothetical protein J8N07_12355 [Chryseobacterium arthrosphaerae]